MSKLTVEQILARGEREGVTPYQIAALVNAKLDEMGHSDLHVRPQMMYNYSANGMIVRGVKEGAHKYTVDQALEYVVTFTTKRVAKNTKVEEVKVEEFDTNSDTEIEEVEVVMI